MNLPVALLVSNDSVTLPDALSVMSIVAKTGFEVNASIVFPLKTVKNFLFTSTFDSILLSFIGTKTDDSK